MTDDPLAHPDFEVTYEEGPVWLDFPSGKTLEMECTGHTPGEDDRDAPAWEEWPTRVLRSILWVERVDVGPLEGVELTQGVKIRDPEQMRDQLVRMLMQYGPCKATEGSLAQLKMIYQHLSE